MEIFLLLLTRLCLLTHPASFRSFQQSEQVSRASPPANVLVMTAWTFLSCHYKETIWFPELSSICLPKFPFSPMLVLMSDTWYRTSLYDYLTYRAQPGQHEVNMGSLSPPATALLHCTILPGSYCHHVVSHLPLSLIHSFWRCFQIQGILLLGCSAVSNRVSTL